MNTLRRVKILGPGEPIPVEARIYCRTCRMWAKTREAARKHHAQFPGHEIIDPKTNLPLQYGRGHYLRPERVITAMNKAGTARPKRKYERKQMAMPRNGNALLNASARDLLLDYVLGKAKEELNAELDRMFRELKSQPIGPARSRTFVAR